MYRSLRRPPTTRPRRDRTRWHRAVSSRHDDERLSDIIDAINAIRSHIARGDLSDGLIFDAVRVRLIEIGEAVKALDPELVASEPAVKWADARLAGAPLLRHISRHGRSNNPSLETAVQQLQTRRKLAAKDPANIPNEDRTKDSGRSG